MGSITLPDGRVLVGASFRGVFFHTVVSELRVGRRNVVNEFPQRDDPSVDDLGRKARRVVVDAYVLGQDHFAQRDKLVEAFEAKGSGELIHPRFGVLNVALDGDASLKEEADKGGMTRITATFVVDGKTVFPAARTSTVSLLEAATNAADEASEAHFAEAYSVAGPSVLASEAIASMNKSVAGLLATARLVSSVEGLADIVRQTTLLSSNIASLIRTPVLLSQSLRSLLATTVQNVNRPLLAFTELQTLFEGNRRTSATSATNSTSTSTSTRARVLVNEAECAALHRRLALTNRARILAVAISNTDVVQTGDQATALRDALLHHLDVELEDYDPPAEVVAALSDVRAAMVRDMALRSEYLLQRSTYTPAAVLPALVLAHRIYQDANRADELVDRNDVRNPAFMPARALEILQ
ncbi:MAG: DNA circularization N-terminal domain-containing protein [Rhodoferax sp.]|nr:DNA circularization N-terminal domain-containing protein [Rhodoferax sp.]